MPADFEVNELAALRVTRRAQNTMCPKENWPKHKASAKFEQGGFTSRRRKGPKTLFPGASPGNSFGVHAPRKLVAMQYRARPNIVS